MSVFIVLFSIALIYAVSIFVLSVLAKSSGEEEDPDEILHFFFAPVIVVVWVIGTILYYLLRRPARLLARLWVRSVDAAANSI